MKKHKLKLDLFVEEKITELDKKTMAMILGGDDEENTPSQQQCNTPQYTTNVQTGSDVEAAKER